MKELIGFDTDNPVSVEGLKALHYSARELEKANDDSQTNLRIAIVEELTKEPSSYSYLMEKLNLLFTGSDE